MSVEAPRSAKPAPTRVINSWRYHLTISLRYGVGAVMLALAKRSAKQAAAEVKHQGGTVAVPAAPGEADLTDLAQAVAGIIVNGYTSAAARTAMQSAVPGASGQDVEASVKIALSDISTSESGWVASPRAAATPRHRLNRQAALHGLLLIAWI